MIELLTTFFTIVKEDHQIYGGLFAAVGLIIPMSLFMFIYQKTINNIRFNTSTIEEHKLKITVLAMFYIIIALFSWISLYVLIPIYSATEPNIGKFILICLSGFSTLLSSVIATIMLLHVTTVLLITNSEKGKKL